MKENEEKLKLQTEQAQQTIHINTNANVEVQDDKSLAPLNINEERKINDKTLEKENLADKFKIASSRKCLMRAMDQQERIQSVTITKKKGIFSKPVQETKTMYKAEELDNKTRQEQADAIRQNIGAVKDESATARMNISAKAKCAIKYADAKLLSAFKGMCTEEMLMNYGKMQVVEDKEKKTKTSKAPDSRNDILETLTNKILGYNPSDLDVSSDKALSKNAATLERMSQELEAYRAILDSNPEYKEKLKNSKTEDGENHYKILTKHMEKLSVISDYYRVRKLIVMDSEYIESKEPINEEILDTDTASTIRLKKMLRTSFILAKRMNNVLTGVSGGYPTLTEGLTKKSNSIYREIDGMLDKVKKVEGADGKFTLITRKKTEIDADVRDQIALYEHECKGSLEYSRRKKMSITDPPNKVMSKAVATELMGGAKAFGVPLYQYLDDHKTPINEVIQQFMVKSTGKTLKEIDETNKKRIKKGEKPIGFEPSKSCLDHPQKYPELKTIHIMDQPSRMAEKSVILNQKTGRSSQESVEFMLNVTMQETKEYEENREKEAYMEYMEDAYADAAMESLVMHYAFMERLVERLGQEAFLLHPIDLARRLTDEDMLDIACAATMSNIATGTQENIMALESFVEKYKKNNPGVPVIDAKKFAQASGGLTSLNFKLLLLNNTSSIMLFGTEDDPDNIEYTKHIDIDELEGEINAFKKDEKNKKYLDLAARCFSPEINKSIIAYFLAHPEKVKPKFFKAVGLSALNTQSTQQSTSARRDDLNLARFGLIKPHTVEEIKQYENKLKKENYIACNTKSKKNGDGYDAVQSDKYGMKLHYEMIVEYVEGKTERKEPITEEDKQQKEKALAEIARIEELEKKYGEGKQK